MRVPSRRASAHLRAISVAVAAAVGVSFYLVPHASARVAVAPRAASLSPAHALVAGSVVSDGHPMAGARVVPMIWPDAATLAAMRTGATVKALTLPSVVADSSGRFSVAVDPTSLPAGYRDAKGHTQVELQISAGSRHVAWDFTALPRGASWSSAKQLSNSSTGVETAVFDLGKAARVTELTGSAATRFARGESAPARGQASATSSTSKIGVVTVKPSVPCVYVAGSWLYDRDEPFMYVYPGQHAPARVTQTYGVDHTLGIAVGGAGGWAGGSAGGSVTISLGASGSMAIKSNSAAFNALNFRDYLNVCGWTHRQAVSVYSILSRIDPAKEPTFTSCQVYSSGTYSKSHGKNITFHGDVNVGPVSVDAQSGWNSSSYVTWTILSRSWLCGNTKDGWVTAPEAEANSA